MLVDTQIPWMLKRSTRSLSSGKGKRSSSPRDGCLKCGGAHFQRECSVHGTARTSNHLAKANEASHVPREIAKESVKRARQHP